MAYTELLAIDIDIPEPQYHVIVPSFTNQRKSRFTAAVYAWDDITVDSVPRPLYILPSTFFLELSDKLRDH